MTFAPVEVLIGVSFGLLFGTVLATAAGGCALLVRYVGGASLPASVVGAIAVVVATAGALYVGVADTTVAHLPRHLVGGGVVFALAAYASGRGGDVAVTLPRAAARPVVRERTLAATAVDSVDAAGQITIQPSGPVRELEGYPSLDPELRATLEEGRWRLPADLPLVVLEARLETRLRTRHGLEAASVTVDDRGRATVAVAPPAGTVSRRVPEGWRAVAIRARIPTGLAPDDDVLVTTAETTVVGTVLRSTVARAGSTPPSDVADPHRSHEEREPRYRSRTPRTGSIGGDGAVTVAVPTADASVLLDADRASLAVRPRGARHGHDAVALLERAGTPIRTVSLTDEVRASVVAGDLEASALAVRSPGTEAGWTVDPTRDDLEAGATALLVGPDASEVSRRCADGAAAATVEGDR